MSTVAADWTEQLAELDRLEELARESSRTLVRRRLAAEQSRAAVPDRGRFLTSRLYPGTVPVDLWSDRADTVTAPGRPAAAAQPA